MNWSRALRPPLYIPMTRPKPILLGTSRTNRDGMVRVGKMDLVGGAEGSWSICSNGLAVLDEATGSSCVAMMSEWDESRVRSKKQV